MRSRRRFFLLTALVLLAVLCWYLFLKGYNYKIRFKTPHAPGTVYSSLYNLQTWNTEDFDSVALANSRPFEELTHHLFINDSSFSINWKIKRLDDSLTQVTALAKDLKNPFIQNLAVPFQKNAFVNRSIRTTQDQMNGLFVHQKDYKVQLSGNEAVTIPSQFCAYVTLESKIYEKGNNMISNIGLIMNYIKSNEIPLTGDPFLQVSSWNPREETIVYDFCFPIKKPDLLPETKTINFKHTEEFKGLKAIFNGNYRLTDRAWYELIDHAQSLGVDFEMRPFEIYRNDPHSGGNELEWVAEVYLPVKE
ncbi:MAG: hypothetical protein HKO90_00465 [Flavobacteriaceae bacterium]|nr:GyrI-like domain-containing protein [Bacteroidia bacterium]NNK86728.1 hypothetical protein [Flavobacteriaceae bacterium]